MRATTILVLLPSLLTAASAHATHLAFSPASLTLDASYGDQAPQPVTITFSDVDEDAGTFVWNVSGIYAPSLTVFSDGTSARYAYSPLISFHSNPGSPSWLTGEIIDSNGAAFYLAPDFLVIDAHFPEPFFGAYDPTAPAPFYGIDPNAPWWQPQEYSFTLLIRKTGPLVGNYGIVVALGRNSGMIDATGVRGGGGCCSVDGGSYSIVAIPEPTTSLLVMTGALGLATSRRRRAN